MKLSWEYKCYSLAIIFKHLNFRSKIKMTTGIQINKNILYLKVKVICS